MLSVGVPDSLEVWLLGDVLWKLVGIDEVLLLDDLWSELGQGFVFSGPGSSALWSGGIKTEVDLSGLISVGEGVENILWVIEMSSMSVPPRMWDLVVEESR